MGRRREAGLITPGLPDHMHLAHIHVLTAEDLLASEMSTEHPGASGRARLRAAQVRSSWQFRHGTDICCVVGMTSVRSVVWPLTYALDCFKAAGNSLHESYLTWR